MEEIRKILINDKNRPSDKNKTNASIEEDVKKLEMGIIVLFEDFLKNNSSLAIDIEVNTKEALPQSTLERLDIITNVRVRHQNRLDRELGGVTDRRCV